MAKRPQTVSLEPNWDDVDSENFDADLRFVQASNWYRECSSEEDHRRWVLEYLKEEEYSEEEIEAAKHFPNKDFSFGYGELAKDDLGLKAGPICRMLSLGAELGPKQMERLELALDRITSYTKKPESSETDADDEDKVDIQGRTASKAASILGRFEVAFDCMILGKKPDFGNEKFGIEAVASNEVSFQEYLDMLRLKKTYLNRIADWAANIYVELDSADPEIQEAYSIYLKNNITKTKEWLKSICAYCESSKSSMGKVIRKKRKKAPMDLVKKMKYCKEFAGLGLKSVSPASIIGAEKVILFNTKYRVLSILESEGPDGFTVRGSTIVNGNEKTSVSRKIRKPELLKSSIFKDGKLLGIRAIKGYWNTLTTEEYPAKFRVGEDTLILGTP